MKTKRLPINLNNISLKKSLKNNNKLRPTSNNFLISLLFLKEKYPNFDIIYEYKNNNDLILEIGNKNNKIVFPYGKKNFTKILKNLILNYSKTKPRFIILPIVIKFTQKYLFLLDKLNYHQNVIIIDLKKKKAEYFEPHGGLYSKFFEKRKFTYHKENFFIQMFNNSLEMYDTISPIFKKLNLKFILPHHYLKLKDFQTIEAYIEPILEKKTSIRKTDIVGYCHNWCIWFVSLRLKYPDADLKELIKKSHIILKTKYTYKNFIRNYSKDIYKKNKKLLQKHKIWHKIFNNDYKYDKTLKSLVEKKFTKNKY